MIFEKDDVSFKLLDVLAIKQGEMKCSNKGRNFDAISFRIAANTQIFWGDKQLELLDNSVCYFPSGLDYTRVSKYDDMIVIHFNSFGYSIKDIEAIYPEDYEKVKELFIKILALWRKKEVGYKHNCTALLYEIFALLYKLTYKEVDGNTKIKNAVDYINKNFTKAEISVKAAAEKANMSEVYFRKLFKEEFLLSPKKYIINLRIKYAETLIEMGYYTLGEISEMCGFTDYKYFSTEFKRILGVLPSKYFYNFPEIAKNQNIKYKENSL